MTEKKLASIKIGAINYAVVYVPNLRHEDDGKLDGCIRHSKTQISIEANMNHQAKTQTILHEIVHAIDTQIGGPHLKEKVVDAFAYGIYQVIRDNPELVKMIVDKKGSVGK